MRLRQRIEMASWDLVGWVYLQRWGRSGPECCMSWEEPLALSASSSSTGGTRLSFDVKRVCACAPACVCVPAAHSAARPACSVHPRAPDSTASSSRSGLAPFSVNSSASFSTCSRDSPLLSGSAAPSPALLPSPRPPGWWHGSGGPGSEEVEWSGALTLVHCHALIQTPPLSPRETELQVCVAWCNHSLISFHPPPPLFCPSVCLLPSSSWAPQISSFVWKVTKQPRLIMLR